MSAEETWNTTIEKESGKRQRGFDEKSGFDPETGIYHSLVKLGEQKQIPTRPDLDAATFVLSQFPDPHKSESQISACHLCTALKVNSFTRIRLVPCSY